MTEPTYYNEAAHLERLYRKAVGECVARGIPVYRTPGGALQSLGELEDLIREHDEQQV